MKKRVLSLLLALVLAVSIFVMPAEAASAKQVHTYLMNLAKGGQYDADNKWWSDGFNVGENAYFGVFYLESSGYIELTMFDEYYEVTWRISSNPSPAYNAYIMTYQGNEAKGTVQIQAGYNGSSFSSFKSYTGDSSRTPELLDVLNERLPLVVEITRLLIGTNNYTLADLGITGYKQCRYVHAYDSGKITKQPTCAQSGEKIFTCTVCGNTRTERVAPTGQHKWDAGTVVVEPSCTQEGTVRYTCTVCAGTKDEIIPELGHAWVLDKVLSKPTSSESHGIARFICTRCETTKRGRLCAAEVFTDMPADGNWAHKPIDWAYFSGITSGKTESTFAPKATITRAEAMTFLWTMAGKPEPTLTESPFTDVQPGKYYYKPVLWAYENHITGGKTDTSFAPKDKCSRAEVMTFLWTAAGKQEPTTTESPFEDVQPGKYYYKPILWAAENNVTGGTSEGEFSPKAFCSRAQVVTFLYKVKDLLQPAE